MLPVNSVYKCPCIKPSFLHARLLLSSFPIVPHVAPTAYSPSIMLSVQPPVIHSHSHLPMHAVEQKTVSKHVELNEVIALPAQRQKRRAHHRRRPDWQARRCRRALCEVRSLRCGVRSQQGRMLTLRSSAGSSVAQRGLCAYTAQCLRWSRRVTTVSVFRAGWYRYI